MERAPLASAVRARAARAGGIEGLARLGIPALRARDAKRAAEIAAAEGDRIAGDELQLIGDLHLRREDPRLRPCPADAALAAEPVASAVVLAEMTLRERLLRDPLALRRQRADGPVAATTGSRQQQGGGIRRPRSSAEKPVPPVPAGRLHRGRRFPEPIFEPGRQAYLRRIVAQQVLDLFEAAASLLLARGALLLVLHFLLGAVLELV